MEAESGLKKRLSGIFGIEHGVCSIVAAEANKRAIDVANDPGFLASSKEQKLFIADRFNANTEPVKKHVYPLLNLMLDSDVTNDHYAKLVLLIDKISTDEPFCPSLAIIVNEDIALEIAHFDNRPGGNCRHIQLGQEIVDDNIVATADSPRTFQVEAIRDVLPVPGDKSGLDIDEKGIQILTNFAKSELQRNTNQITELLMPSVCQLAEKYFSAGEEHQKKELSLYKDGGNGELIEYPNQLVNAYINGYYQSMTIPRDMSSHDYMGKELVIVVTQTVQPKAELEAKFPLRRKIARWLLDADAMWGVAADEQPITEQYANSEQYQLVALARDQVGVDVATFYNGKVYVSDDTTTEKRFATLYELKVINDLLKPAGGTLGEKFPVDGRIASINKLVETFHIHEKIDSYLGEDIPNLEKVLRLLSKATAAGDYQSPRPIGIDDVEMGETSTRALLDVIIKHRGRGRISLNVFAKPVALEDAEPSDIYGTLEFHKFGRNNHSQDIINEVLDILEKTNERYPFIRYHDGSQGKIMASNDKVIEKPAWWKGSNAK